MIVSSQALSDAVTGAGRVIPEAGDNDLTVPASVQLVAPALLKAIVGIPTGEITPDSSVFASFSENKIASQAITVATLLELPPGSYTIDAFISARFVITPTGGDGTPDIRIDLINESLTTGAIICGVHAQTITNPTANRRMDIIIVEPSLIRRISNATVAGQTMTHSFSVSVERHL